MFTAGIKGSQRTNGVITTSSNHRPVKTKLLTNQLKEKTLLAYGNDFSVNRNAIDVNSSFQSLNHDVDLQSAVNGFQTIFKCEPDDQDFESHITAHSIIGFSDDDSKINRVKISTVNKPHFRKSNMKSNYHETLERIESESGSYNYYQKHWFSSSLERLKLEDRSREERLELTRYELKKQLKQIMESKVGQPNNRKNMGHVNSSHITNCARSTISTSHDRLVAPRNCDIESCNQAALPCTRYCTLHIMHNSEQVLFDYCTAKFADNTQCSVPVFDITHELPLCPEHARKRDNYKLYQEAKPKKLRKKVKPSAMIRPQKRNKKKRRPVCKQPEVISRAESIESTVPEVCDEESVELTEDVVEQVLAMQEEPDGLELVSVEEALVTQASHLLEGTDINTVLSTIQADEFNDLFTVNRNGEYEPSREETEELERALAAVDNDVKSLEKLSQSQGLLDSLLDEHTLVESLVQIPDMFHNGYVPCGDSMVAQTSTRLLPVEPHSHS